MKFQMNRFGLKHDPRGAHVTLNYQGRTLLGEVTDCWRDEVCGVVRLTVRHFNGESWPIYPAAMAVNVHERE